MKITAITRYKHGDLYAILTRLGWSQLELSRRSGVSATAIASIINLKARPTRRVADAIQFALGEAGEYLDVLEQWPESFGGMKGATILERTMDVPMESLIGCDEAMNKPFLPYSETIVSMENVRKRISAATKDLTDREKKIIELRFYDGKSYKQAGIEIGISQERARQLEAKALRKLRHPKRIRHLESCKVDAYQFADAVLSKKLSNQRFLEKIKTANIAP